MLSSLLGLHAELERMIHDVVGEGARVGRARKWAPPADVFISGGNIVARFEIAGVRREDLEVVYRDGELRVSGVRVEHEGEPKDGYWQMEIAHGPFERVVKIPKSVNPDGIEAKARDGILEVRLPVAPPGRTGTVRIHADG